MLSQNCGSFCLFVPRSESDFCTNDLLVCLLNIAHDFLLNSFKHVFLLKVHYSKKFCAPSAEGLFLWCHGNQYKMPISGLVFHLYLRFSSLLYQFKVLFLMNMQKCVQSKNKNTKSFLDIYVHFKCIIKQKLSRRTCMTAFEMLSSGMYNLLHVLSIQQSSN